MTVYEITVSYIFLHVDTPQAPAEPDVRRTSPTSVELSWVKPKSDGGSKIKGYIIEKKVKGEPWTQVTTDTVDGTSFTVRGLPEDEDVEFRISAVNKAGAGSPSNTVVIAFKPPGPPSTPEVSDVDKTSVTLTWTPPKQDGGTKVTGYIVEKREKGRDRWVRINRSPVREVTMSITELVEKNEYEFRVIAENKVGPGEPSSPSERIVAKAPYGKFCSMMDTIYNENQIYINTYSIVKAHKDILQSFV